MLSHGELKIALSEAVTKTFVPRTVRSCPTVESLEARVISRFPFRPSRAGTITIIGSTSGRKMVREVYEEVLEEKEKRLGHP